MSSFKTEVIKDFNTKTVRVIREFAAPVEHVWRAFTEAALLDQWWGPKPWRAETKTMDFREGGHWLYAMVSPDETQRHWGRMNYFTIQVNDHYTGEDGFCDENGELNPNFPVSQMRTQFTQTAAGTLVEMSSVHASEADLQTLIDMGFEEGITVCFDQLAELVQAN